MSHFNRPSGRKWQKFLLPLYLMGLGYVLFFAEAFGRSSDRSYYSYNLIPFHEIHRFLSYWRILGIWNVLINLAGNVICFIPFGILIPYHFPRLRHPVGVTALSCLFSGLIETLQLVYRVGCFDVDDILLNTIGGLIGALCMLKWKKHRAKKKASA